VNALLANRYVYAGIVGVGAGLLSLLLRASVLVAISIMVGAGIGGWLSWPRAMQRAEKSRRKREESRH
jgi:hypothetical protein